MLTKQGRLAIFDSFVIDYTLPKAEEREKQRRAKARIVFSDSESTEDSKEGINYLPAGSSLFVMGSDDSGVSSKDARKYALSFGEDGEGAPPKNWFRRVLAALSIAQKKPAPSVAPAKPIGIIEFFASVKDSAEQIKIVEERATGYERLLLRAKRNGQEALVEDLAKGIDVVRGETQLLAMELPKYLTEEKLIEFVKQTKRGLRLDWIRHFTRIIPEDVAKKKTETDDRLIFDNYVILHYDPDKKSVKEPEKDKKAKADPILFGVIDGSRKLYFVGDWKDELCDLTLDQVAEVIGKESISVIDPKSYAGKSAA